MPTKKNTILEEAVQPDESDDSRTETNLETEDPVSYTHLSMEQRLHGTNLIVSYYIALNTGLRESEVFALQWPDVDFEKKKIKVCKQLLFQDHKWCFCPLKTINAYRSVNITDSFCTFLASLKEQHEQNKALYLSLIHI